jgi:hypothetical protein
VRASGIGQDDDGRASSCPCRGSLDSQLRRGSGTEDFSPRLAASDGGVHAGCHSVRTGT